MQTRRACASPMHNRIMLEVVHVTQLLHLASHRGRLHKRWLRTTWPPASWVNQCSQGCATPQQWSRRPNAGSSAMMMAPATRGSTPQCSRPVGALQATWTTGKRSMQDPVQVCDVHIVSKSHCLHYALAEADMPVARLVKHSCRLVDRSPLPFGSQGKPVLHLHSHCAKPATSPCLLSQPSPYLILDAPQSGIQVNSLMR